MITIITIRQFDDGSTRTQVRSSHPGFAPFIATGNSFDGAIADTIDGLSELKEAAAQPDPPIILNDPAVFADTPAVA